MNEQYTLQNALRFNWSSVTGTLNSERVSHLERYLVGGRILDAGCGGGAYVHYLVEQGLEVTGIDKYRQFLQAARDAGRKGDFVEADITDMPFEDGTFDCSYCFDVLEHVDARLAIRELRRVTSRRIIFAVPRQNDELRRFGLTFLPYEDRTHLRYYTEESVNNLVESIHPRDTKVFPELAVPLDALFNDALRFKRVDSRFYKMLIGVSQMVLPRLLKRTTYFQPIYAGLVAIIDI